MNLSAFGRADALFQQWAVELEADRRNVAALLRPENVSRAANFEVTHGDFESAAESRVLLDGADPFAGVAQQTSVARDKQIGIGLMLVASHPAPQLVKIAQAKPVGAIDDDRIRVGNIEAAFD